MGNPRIRGVFRQQACKPESRHEFWSSGLRPAERTTEMRRELQDFLDYCRIERRLAPLTCSAYERDVGTCIAFLEREGLVTVGEVRPQHLRRFLAEESVRRPAPSSQARTVAALKCFFRFLEENEQIDRDPARVLRTPKKREALPDVLDRRELARLLDSAELEGVWKRNHD